MPLHLAALSGSVACVQVCLDALERRSDDLDFQVEVQRKNFMVCGLLGYDNCLRIETLPVVL